METPQPMLLDLFDEYITLEYNKYSSNQFHGNKQIDTELGELIISRWDNYYCKVINLTNGELLRIPCEFIRLCYGFYKSRGEEIVRLKDTPKSPLWDIIVVSVRIMEKKPVNPSRLRDTENIRDWLNTKHNIKIEPIIYFKGTLVIKL